MWRTVRCVMMEVCAPRIWSISKCLVKLNAPLAQQEKAAATTALILTLAPFVKEAIN